MEQLCDEAEFLIDDELLNLLAPLEKEKQTVVKLDSLLCSLGLEEEDVPKLAHFLLKYEQQQRERTEDICVEFDEYSNKAEEVETHLSSELIHPNHVVPALKSFLQQHVRTRGAISPPTSQFSYKNLAYFRSLRGEYGQYHL
ncbi:dynein regulatory complex protein 1-like [Plectropomus leopardus]|uniref:dynein regulatory complex protein 1-like n=1 Tax=Plectropomus leopardus TaxID=160734 RepID=UPI001C4B4C52|nr:dynein regulatory complex protein 1-like [Plectropomus leopardus]